MKTIGLLLSTLLVLVGCSTTDMTSSDARQSKQVEDSVVRLAENDYLFLRGDRIPYSSGSGSRWMVSLCDQDSPGNFSARWGAELGAIDESRPLETYQADLKIFRDRITAYTPWNNESSVIDRLDGRIVGREIGKRLFDRSPGKGHKMTVRFSQSSSDFTNSGTMPSGALR